MAESENDPEYQGVLLGNLGDLYQEKGASEEASQYYLRSLEVARQVGDRQGEGAQLGSLGYLAVQSGEWERAAEYLQRARKIANEVGDRRFEAIWLSNLAVLEERQGRLDTAAEWNAKAREMASNSGARVVSSYVLLDFARANRLRGKLVRAGRALEELEREVEGHGTDDLRSRLYCEKAHLALAKGEPYDIHVKVVERLCATMQLGGGAELAAAKEVLYRSVRAFREGQELLYGTALSDHPQAQLQKAGRQEMES